MSERIVGWWAVALLGVAVGAGTGCSEPSDDDAERPRGDAGSSAAGGGDAGQAGRDAVAGEGGESATAGTGGAAGGNSGEAGQAGHSGGEVPVLDDARLADATFLLSYRQPSRDGNYGPWLVYLDAGAEGSVSLNLIEETTGFSQLIELERREDGLYGEPGVWSPLAVVRYDWEPLVPGDCARNWRVVPIDVDGDGGADQLRISVELDGDSDISSDYASECGQHEVQREAELVAKRIEPAALTLKVLRDAGVRFDEPLEPLRPSVRPNRRLSPRASATLTTRTGTFPAKFEARRDGPGWVDGFSVDVVQKPGDVAVWHVFARENGRPVAADDPDYFAPFDVAFALPAWGVMVDGSFESYTEPSSYPQDTGAYYGDSQLTTGLTGNVGLLVHEARLRVTRPEGGNRLKLLVSSKSVEMLAGAVGGEPGVPELLREVPCDENPLACEAPIYEYAYDLGDGDLGDEVLLRLREPGTCYGCAGEEGSIIDDVRVE